MRGEIGTTKVVPFPRQSVWIGEPAQAAGGDAGDAEFDSVAVAEFGGAVFQETDQRSVDVSKAQEAEVVGADRASHRG